MHYLANADAEMRFALVSDWVDAPAETAPEDDELLAAARDGIARLNVRHGQASDGGDRFLLFHRRRAWNEREGVWMGWERKRGKLHELNRLLRGATDTTFLPPVSATAAAPAGVRYVITLDADTRLPSGAARKLVGAMAHPLNRPRFDPAVGRVVEGYGLLQPRVSPTLPEDGEGSAYRRIFSGPSGIDPVCLGGLGRLPGPVRRGLLHRQGHLRRRRVRDGPVGPRAREHAAEPRSVRRPVRARRARHRRLALRGLPVELPRRRRAPASLGPRRLAASALDRRMGRRADLGDRSLEDARQSPAHAVGSRHLPHARRRLDPAGRLARHLDHVRARHHRARRPGARPPRDRAAADGDLEAQSRARSGLRSRDRRLAGGAHRNAAGAPGDRDGRRHRPARWSGCSSRAGACSNG